MMEHTKESINDLIENLSVQTGIPVNLQRERFDAAIALNQLLNENAKFREILEQYINYTGKALKFAEIKKVQPNPILVELYKKAVELVK